MSHQARCHKISRVHGLYSDQNHHDHNVCFYFENTVIETGLAKYEILNKIQIKQISLFQKEISLLNLDIISIRNIEINICTEIETFLFDMLLSIRVHAHLSEIKLFLS